MNEHSLEMLKEHNNKEKRMNIERFIILSLIIEQSQTKKKKKEKAGVTYQKYNKKSNFKEDLKNKQHHTN